MGRDTAMLVLAIVGGVCGWTITAISATLWITNRLNHLEGILYTELNKHRREIAGEFEDIRTRVQVLELKDFGATRHP